MTNLCLRRELRNDTWTNNLDCINIYRIFQNYCSYDLTFAQSISGVDFCSGANFVVFAKILSRGLFHNLCLLSVLIEGKIKKGSLIIIN